jgi:hypothetical protein
MSKKKTLLEEGTVRRFMKLANMEAVGTGFVNEMYTSPMADEEPMKEEYMADDDEPEAADDLPEDEMEVDDLEIEDEEDEEPEEEVGMDASDMGELPEITLTPDQAQVIIQLGDMLKTVDMGEPEVEELPAPAMDAVDMEPADEMEEEPMMDDMVNEVARRVARRLNEMKKSK